MEVFNAYVFDRHSLRTKLAWKVQLAIGIVTIEAPDLAAHVQDNCPALRMAGLMTIGAPGDASCFDSLRSCRDAVAARLDVPPESLELSMGMSGDFEAATLAGSTSVRVGSSIFGARAYPPKA